MVLNINTRVQIDKIPFNSELLLNILFKDVIHINST